MLMAGLDGIINRIDPGEPMDKNLYDLPPKSAAPSSPCPARCTPSWTPWSKTTSFCCGAKVFTRDVLETWLELKRKEADEVNIRPHPYEFYLYFDA